MQQLTTLNDWLSTMTLNSQAIIIDQPLPPTPLATTRFVNQLCHCFKLQNQELEWGIDRCQVLLSGAMNSSEQNIKLMLHIEWNCEAMWLESLGGSYGDTAALWERLQASHKPTINH